MDINKLKALYELGKSLALQGDRQGADGKFQEVITEAMKSSNEDSKDVLYKAYKGRLDMNVDNTDLRNSLTAIVLEIFGEDPDVLWDMAQYHKVVGDHHRYVDALERLNRQFPNNKHKAAIALDLGLVYHHDRKDIRGAIRHYVDFLNNHKKDASAKIAAVNLAACYNAINQPDRAKTILKQYLNIG